VVSEAGDSKEEVLVVECDPARSEDTRRNWPFLRDRRIDAYQPIQQRWIGE
jgi:N-carbamoylputrescine amidase